MNTVFKSKIFKVFQHCEAHNPQAVVYALSVQSFKHYNRLARRSCVVRVLGKGIMPRVHIAARQLYHRRRLCEHDGDLSIGYWQESSPRPNEDIFVRPEAILVMSLTFAWFKAAVYMYTGFSCPVNSLYIDVGIVFMWIWGEKNYNFSSVNPLIIICSTCLPIIVIDITNCSFNLGSIYLRKQRIRSILERSGTNLSNRSCKEVHNPLMGHSNDALSVDLNDPVTNSNAPPLCDASS